MAIKLPPRKVRGAWTIGELGYRLRNNQRIARTAASEAYKKGIKFYLECHRRFGKSDYGLTWLSEDCIKNPGSVSAYFAPVKEGLSDYIGGFEKPDTPLGSAFADCPLDLRPTLDSSLTLHFPNGSSIIFRGSNNKTHRTKRGNAFRKVFIDEPRDVDELDVLLESVVIPSLFSTEGQVMLGSTPADTEDHPLHAIKQIAEREGWFFHWDIMQSSQSDPQDFPLARIEQWKKETTDPVAWDREYLALWVKDPTKTVIPEWDGAYVQIVPHDEFFPFYHKYAALDSGVTDKTAGLLAYYDFHRAKLVVEDEFVLEGSEVRTDRIAQELKKREVALSYQVLHDRKDPRYAQLPVNEKMFRRVADNNNLILVNDLNSLYSLDFYPTSKDELAAMVNMTREWAKDGRILVHPQCKETLGCLNNALWDKHREKLAKSKVYGHFDALMALVYLVRNVDTATNPIPKFFGKSWATHAGVPLGAHGPETAGEKLAAVFGVKRSATDQARADFVKGQVQI